MSQSSSQVKIILPENLYAQLSAESQQAGVTMADIVRLSLVDRYERRDTTRQLTAAIQHIYQELGLK